LADIHVAPDGKFVYASNRGHDSLVIYRIDPTDGTLSLVGHQSVLGKWPRNFVIDPSGKLLLVANQNTDNVVSFYIDSQTGLLQPTGQVIDVPTPVCLKFASF
jgi:6-phosphogluconolactonase